MSTPRNRPPLLACLAALACASLALPAAARTRWSEQAARDGYGRQPWLVGANHIPANAINELEMWQADTFEPERIDRELDWAESIGGNTTRDCLHHLPRQQDG